MLTVTVGKSTKGAGMGRNRRVLEFPHLNRSQLHCMTERTQLQMFGEVVHKRYDRSIHPFGRRRVSAKKWAEMKAIAD